MRVEQLMTRAVHSCEPDASLNRAAQLMWDHDCGCIPIVDSDNKVIGMITDRDIAMAAYTRGEPLAAIRIGDVMAQRVHTCGQSEALTVAEERMRKYQVRRLPVTDATGYLVGLVSVNDLALEAKRARGTRQPPIKPDEVAATLAGICEHRGPSQLVAAQ
jgi:CBS domain-containing protein